MEDRKYCLTRNGKRTHLLKPDTIPDTTMCEFRAVKIVPEVVFPYTLCDHCQHVEEENR